MDEMEFAEVPDDCKIAKPAATAMTLAEQERRDAVENDIDANLAKGRDAYLAVGKGLAEILESRLYRSDYASFEEYCQDFWGISDSLARKWVDAWRVATNLAEDVADMPILSWNMLEGFNPSHDVCRFVIDGAVTLAARQTGRAIDSSDFVLEGRPDACPETSRDAATWLRLDDAALDRKIDAALQYPELRDEVHAALQRFGRGAFAVECLRPVTTALMLDTFDRELPAYERYGEQRVREGRYTEIIRYRQHVLPVRAAIEAAVHDRVADAVR